MSTEITLCVEDDGSMYIKAGAKEPVEQEVEEGGEKTPVKSIEEAIEMIRQLAEQASIGPPGEGMATDDAGLTEDPAAAGQENAAMEENFRPGVTGR